MRNPDANNKILRPSLSTRITAAPVATTYDKKIKLAFVLKLMNTFYAMKKVLSFFINFCYLHCIDNKVADAWV